MTSGLANDHSHLIRSATAARKRNVVLFSVSTTRPQERPTDLGLVLQIEHILGPRVTLN